MIGGCYCYVVLGVIDQRTSLGRNCVLSGKRPRAGHPFTDLHVWQHQKNTESSLFLSFSLSLFLSLHLSVCLSVCLFLHLDISIHFRLSSPMYSFYLSLSLFYRRRRVILGRSASRGPYPPPLISSFLLVIFWSRFSCLPFFGPRRYRRCRRHCF